MTISTTDSRISYNGNSVTTVFSFPYRFLANGDLVVVSVDAAGVETTKVLTTDYTVTGAGDDAGGSVTMIVAPATGTRLVIYRDTNIVQETDYISGDPFPAETHERALDRLTMISQELAEADSLNLRLSKGTSTGVSTELPLPEANKLIGWDSAGTSLANYTSAPEDVSISAFMETVLVATDESAALDTLGFQDTVKVGRNADNLGMGLQVGGKDETYGTNGVLLSNDGNHSWLRFQPSKNESALEALLYSAGAQGRASAASGTNQVTRVSGTLFDTAWVGKKFYLGDTIYKVATVPTTGTMTVTTAAGGAVSFGSNFTETFHVCYVSGTGTCSVVAGVVSRTSGDPFIPFITTPYVFKLGSTAYTVSAFTDIDTQTITSPPADGTYTYTFETDINNQMVTLRVQKVTGADEENLSIYADYKGYHLRSFYAGSGELRPIFIGNSGYSSLVAYDNGDTTIGGEYGADAIRVLAPSGTIANRFETIATTTGLIPAWRARGTDTNVNMGFDTQGTGSFKFTSHSFGNTEFEIFGDGGNDWLAAGSETGKGVLSAVGASTNVDIQISPKGSGAIWLGTWTSNADAAVNGYALMKDSGGTLRKFATIA